MLLMSLMCAVGVVVVVVVATIVDVAMAEGDAGRGAGEEVVAVVEDVGAGAGVVDVALVLLEPLHDGARRHKHHAVPQKLGADPDLLTLPLVAFHPVIGKKGNKLWMAMQAPLLRIRPYLLHRIALQHQLG